MTGLVGAGTIGRLVLRRDRIRLPVWVGVIAALTAWSAQAILSLYTDESQLAEFAATVDSNAAVIALSGPPRAVDTYGGRVAFEVWQSIVVVALLGLLTVVRHTRHEEESGRAELLRAGVLGRHAHSVVALVTAILAGLALGLLASLALIAQDLPVAGSIALGLGMASVCAVFGAVGLLAAQVTEHGRTATGIGLAVVGATFLARAVGDIGNGALSWLSPFGWAQYVRPYAGEQWAVFVVPVVATVVLGGIAIAIEARRDVDAGLVQPRPGRPRAHPSLGTPLGLAWRLLRGSLVAWAVGAVVLAAAMGTMAESADDLVGDNQAILDYLASAEGATLAELFLSTMLVYMALMGGAAAVQGVVRLRSEETAGRVEPLLATGLDRRVWMGAHVAVAAVGGLVVLLGSAAAMGLTYGLSVGDIGQTGTVLMASLAYVPPVLVVVAGAALVVGVVPRASGLAWLVLGWATFVGVLGDGLDLPQVARDVSPFAHIPAVPARSVEVTPLVVLSVLAVVLMVGALVGVRRRDIASTA